MSDNESAGLEKPKSKRNYVRTPARDEAIKKMREAREKALKEKSNNVVKAEPTQSLIEDPTPKVTSKHKRGVNKQISQVIDIPTKGIEEEEEEGIEEKIIVKKKPTKKRPTVIYVESESDESEPEQIIIKKKSKSKGKKVPIIESSSEEEESEDTESREEVKYNPPPPVRRGFIEPPKLRFL